jgi:cytochrome c peroxidase
MMREGGRTAVALVGCVMPLVLGLACGDVARVGDWQDSGVPVADLGRMLFFDSALSADGSVSCATCHKPERAYSDGLVHASGVFGHSGTRNTPSILDVGQQRSLFWDGRRAIPAEHGLRDRAELIGKINAEARYAAAFQAVYGIGDGNMTAEHVARALTAFERTLVSGPSPFDRFLAGQRDALSPAARLGWMVFDQQAHCTRCHAVATDTGNRPMFTDHQFHSLAIGLRKVERKLPDLTEHLIALRGRDGSLGRDVLNDADIAELGRFVVTLDPRDLAAFKTPSLRNVALTAPYMHDGSVATLAEAVDFEVYGRGVPGEPPLIVTPVERGELVAFLLSLTADNLATVAPGG